MAKAPNTVVAICITVVVVALIGGFTALAYAGKDADALSKLVNTLLNTLGLVTGAGAFLYAGAASRSADKAVEQTNGALDKRIQTAVQTAMQNYGVTSVEGGDDSGRPSV